MTTRNARLGWLLAAAAMMGCGGDDTCPTVQGNWRVTQHCASSQVGSTFTMNQTGCTLTVAASGITFSGSVGVDGTFSQIGTVGGATMTCSGNVNGGTITMTCNQAGAAPCAVTLVRQ